MNKLLIVLLVFGAAGLVYYLMGGNDDGVLEDAYPDADVAVEDIEQALQETNTRTIYGSCNAVAEKSSCIDYVGSMWTDHSIAELNCDGVGTYSENACPYAEFGGCQTNGETVMEVVIWAYREGPGGYDEESVPYARAACDANPTAQWVMPDDQF